MKFYYVILIIGVIVNDERLNIVDEDFSSILKFKGGGLNSEESKVDVDYPSIILLYGYLNNHKDWYFKIKEAEELEFEYKSYADFSAALFNQLFDLTHRFTMREGRISMKVALDALKLVCDQINTFCKGNPGGIKLGEALFNLDYKQIREENHPRIWSEIVLPIMENAFSLRKSEADYVKYFHENLNERLKTILGCLPEEIRYAHTEVTDIVKEKMDNVEEFYSRVNIASAFDALYQAVLGGNTTEIKSANKALLLQCEFVNECAASPCRGDLSPMFNFDRVSDLVEYVKNGHNSINAELVNIDFFAVGNKKRHLDNMKKSIYSYVNSTISLAKKSGDLKEDFDLEALCKNSLVNENTHESVHATIIPSREEYANILVQEEEKRAQERLHQVEAEVASNYERRENYEEKQTQARMEEYAHMNDYDSDLQHNSRETTELSNFFEELEQELATTNPDIGSIFETSSEPRQPLM